MWSFRIPLQIIVISTEIMVKWWDKYKIAKIVNSIQQDVYPPKQKLIFNRKIKDPI